MACWSGAIDAYLRRHNTDTNPRIMEVLTLEGESDNHWFYMSKEAVFTTCYVLNGISMDQFEGKLDDLPPEARQYFSHAIPYDYGTMRAQDLVKMGFKSYEEYALRFSRLVLG